MESIVSIKQFSLEESNLVKAFYKLPYQLHAKHAQWIPPLQVQQAEQFSKKHPFWEGNECKLFLAYLNEKIVGRVALIKSKTTQIAHFGFLDFIDELGVSKSLLNALPKALVPNKQAKLLGPFSPSFNYELGILIEGFELSPKFLMPWHPPYYHKHLIQHGFQLEKKFCAYELPVNAFQFSPRMKRIKTYLRKQYKVSYRNMNFNALESEVDLIEKLYNEAFRTHWGFQVFTRKEIMAMAKDLKFIANPNMLFFVYLEDKPVGFIIGIPDLNEILDKVSNGKLFPFGWLKILLGRRKIKEVRVLNAVVADQYRNKGIGVLLYEEFYQRMRTNHYHSTELSWVLVDNVSMTNAAKALGGKVVKGYGVFAKRLSTNT